MGQGAENKKRMYGEATLELHRKIREAVEKVAGEEYVPCVLVSAVEKEVQKDPRTVKFHLQMFEEAGYGTLSKDGKMFCPAKDRKQP